MANNPIPNPSQQLPVKLFPKPLITTNLSNGITTTTNHMIYVSASDDTKILKQIQSSHGHDTRLLDVKPILDVVEDILHRARRPARGDYIDGAQDLEVVDVLEEQMGGEAAGHKGTMLEEIAIAIQKLGCEFTCKCTAGDAHASTMAILNTLGSYSWDAKVVLTLAAFAVAYGELWLVNILHTSNPLARSIAVLKQTPENSEINGVLKPRFAAINDVMKLMVDVAKCLIDLRQLPSKYITPEDPPLATSMNQIAFASYWTIRSIVTCGAQIVNIGITSGIIEPATEAWDLSSLIHKEKSIHDQLVHRLYLCHEFIEAKKEEEAYNNLLFLIKTPQKDNMRILKALIYPQNDIQPLFEVSTKKRVHIDVLKGKTVLLFISDLDISDEDLTVMENIYRESRKNPNELHYEIVWLPIMDRTIAWTKEQENRFKELQCKMPWYTLFHPSLLESVSTKFIKEEWGFSKKQIIVSIDSMGKVVSQNALHMILIWGNAAYPFTTIEEEELWKKQTWSLDFLVNSIHPDIPKWIAQGDVHICLFGGEDIEWIRKFTASMKNHAIKTLGIKLELVYIGKHNSKEAMKKIMASIHSEKLAHTLPNLTHVWYFWTRLEAMLYSKMHHGKDVNNDEIVKEVMSVLTYDGGDQGWGLIGKGGSTIIVQGRGDAILNVLDNFQKWKHLIAEDVLGPIGEQMKPQYSSSTHHCNRVVLPAIEGAAAPRVVACADCCRPMDKYIMYRCCTG